MEKNFKDILNSREIELPSGLRRAVFERIEKEKIQILASKRLFLRIGFVASGLSSIVALAIFGKEILSSEFIVILYLGFSDMRLVAVMWQDYAYSLLETMPTVSIAMMLLPIFISLELLSQYGKLGQYGQGHLSNH